MKRNAHARVLRDNEEIYDGTIVSLRRFTEDVNEVVEGVECGVGLAGFADFEEGDVIEVYKRERVA